ncbi:HPr kinase/phosphorylase [Thermodesulfobacteriota bacterium]
MLRNIKALGFDRYSVASLGDGVEEFTLRIRSKAGCGSGRLDTMKTIRIQGVLVNVHGVGILIRGAPGIGKSMASLRLMHMGHKLVADDMVEVESGSDGKLTGRPVEPNVRVEVRGLGIFEARSLVSDGTAPASPIDLVVELDSFDPRRDAGRLSPDVRRSSILEQELPFIRMPVPDKVDPAFLVELLAQYFRSEGL